MMPNVSTTRCVLRAAALLCLTTMLAGCDAIAAITYVVAPRPKHEALYEIPNKKTVILVEDLENLTSNPSLPRNISANIEKWLTEGEKPYLTEVVPQEQLETYLASLGAKRDETPLGSIAAHFGANQLIYAQITDYQMDIGGGVYRPQVMVEVKVLDMDTRTRVFPIDRDEKTGIQSGRESYSVISKLPAINRSAEGISAETIATQQLAAQAGEDIAKLFFDWREDEPGESLGRK